MPHPDRLASTISPAALSAYLHRIGWTGTPPGAADRATLDRLIALHTRSIPFENLDPLHAREVDIAPSAVVAKLVGSGRGGYCFEHGRLFAEVLRALGFAVAEYAARVLWNQPPGALSPRTHMLLGVTVGKEELLADVGFGGLTLTASLRLDRDDAQATPHERFRLQPGPLGRQLEACLDGHWKPLYAFDTQPQQAVDYLPANYYLSTHPDSKFVHHLMVARAGEGERWMLMNRQLTRHRIDAPAERRTLAHLDELAAALVGVFLLPPAAVDAARPRLAALFAA